MGFFGYRDLVLMSANTLSDFRIGGLEPLPCDWKLRRILLLLVNRPLGQKTRISNRHWKYQVVYKLRTVTKPISEMSLQATQL
jgi:hypothetical protein